MVVEISQQVSSGVYVRSWKLWGTACWLPSAVGPAYPEQVSAAPIAVSWAAVSQALALCVCVCVCVCVGGGGRLEVGESGSGAESHLLPHEHSEVLNSALGRGFWGLAPWALLLLRWRNQPISAGLGRDLSSLLFISIVTGGKSLHLSRLSFLNSKMALMSSNLSLFLGCRESKKRCMKNQL